MRVSRQMNVFVHILLINYITRTLGYVLGYISAGLDAVIGYDKQSAYHHSMLCCFKAMHGLLHLPYCLILYYISLYMKPNHWQGRSHKKFWGGGFTFGGVLRSISFILLQFYAFITANHSFWGLNPLNYP